MNIISTLFNLGTAQLLNVSHNKFIAIPSLSLGLNPFYYIFTSLWWATGDTSNVHLCQNEVTEIIFYEIVNA